MMSAALSMPVETFGGFGSAAVSPSEKKPVSFGRAVLLTD
jgi:hypothetical protein